MTFKHAVALLLTLLLALFAGSALAEEPAETNEGFSVFVDGSVPGGVIEVDISRVSTLHITANQPIKSLRSSSSRASIAPDGTLTVKRTGSFRITVTSESGEKQVISFKAVKKALSVQVSGKAHTLSAGQKLTLKATLAPSGLTSKKVIWSSSNPSAALVDARGRVTAQSVSEVQTAVITATAADGSGVFGTFELTVTPVASSVKLCLDGEIVNGQTLYVDVNALSTLNLTAIIEPSGASQAVKWTSSSRSRAKVTDGRVSILKRGDVTITATAQDGSRISARVKIKIAAISKSVTVSGTDTLPAGKSAKLSAQVLPKGTTDKKVVWSSSDPSVLSVDSSGRIKAGSVLSATRVTITASARDGGAIGAWTVTVTPRALSVNVSRDGANIPNVVFIDTGSNASVSLSASVYPADAAQSVTWKSGNTRVVRVDNNGVLTPVRSGKTTVTATANDGTGVKRTFYVAVGSFSSMPYYIEVDKANQVVRVYERGDGSYTHLVRRMICSTGRSGTRFSDGLYALNGSRTKWCKAMNGTSYMQYATRISGHFMFHGVPTDIARADRVKANYYHQLGSKASDGCIRLLCADAKWIFDNVPSNTFVLVMTGVRSPAEYGAVSAPTLVQSGSFVWDPSDDNSANPYYDAAYTSLIEE